MYKIFEKTLYACRFSCITSWDPTILPFDPGTPKKYSHPPCFIVYLTSYSRGSGISLSLSLSLSCTLCILRMQTRVSPHSAHPRALLIDSFLDRAAIEASMYRSEEGKASRIAMIARGLPRHRLGTSLTGCVHNICCYSAFTVVNIAP